MAIMRGVLDSTLVFGGKNGKTGIGSTYQYFWLRSPETAGTCDRIEYILVQKHHMELRAYRFGETPTRCMSMKEGGGCGSGCFYTREKRRSCSFSTDSFVIFGKEGQRTAQTWDPPPLVLIAAGREIEVMEGLPGSLWSNDMIED